MSHTNLIRFLGTSIAMAGTQVACDKAFRRWHNKHYMDREGVDVLSTAVTGITDITGMCVLDSCMIPTSATPVIMIGFPFVTYVFKKLINYASNIRVSIYVDNDKD
jgi:hypothetical protein